jgi:hypothetical protein
MNRFLATPTPEDRQAELVEWLRLFPAADGLCWARPCPLCGSMVTDPTRHLARAHGAARA